MSVRGGNVKITMELLNAIKAEKMKFKSFKEICETLGICKTTLERIFRASGGHKNFEPEECFEKLRIIKENRKILIRKKKCIINLQHLEKLKELLQKGKSQRDISLEMDISKSTVQRIIKKGGGIDNFSVQQAIPQVVNGFKINKYRENNFYIRTQQKIDALEMQMEIVLETLKQLKEKQID